MPNLDYQHGKLEGIAEAHAQNWQGRSCLQMALAIRKHIIPSVTRESRAYWLGYTRGLREGEGKHDA